MDRLEIKNDEGEKLALEWLPDSKRNVVRFHYDKKAETLVLYWDEYDIGIKAGHAVSIGLA